MDINKKRKQEIKIITLMIHLYCQHHHDINEKELCQYAINKINKCPIMETKTFCSQCSIHCYQKDKQKQIKKVMLYSGPLMIFYHPIIAIRHLLLRRKNENRLFYDWFYVTCIRNHWDHITYPSNNTFFTSECLLLCKKFTKGQSMVSFNSNLSKSSRFFCQRKNNDSENKNIYFIIC